jgi:DNA-binding beta-propeller fold protein YncE
VLDANTGAFKRMWGAFGNVPLDARPAPLRDGITGLAEPARAAADVPAAARAGGAPPPPKTPPGPQQFGDPVHSVKVSSDGLVYVADRSNGRVQVFTLEGKYVSQLFTGGSPGGLVLSPDPQQQFLYVGDGARILVVDRKTLNVLSQDQFGKRGSVSTHLLAIDSKGNIYTTELDRGTQKFVFKGIMPNRRIQ